MSWDQDVAVKHSDDESLGWEGSVVPDWRG